MMKTYLCCLLLLFTFAIAKGQPTSANPLELDGTPKTYQYQLMSDAPIWECDILGKREKDTQMITLESGYRFYFVRFKNNDTIVIKVVKFSDNKKDSITKSLSIQKQELYNYKTVKDLNVPSKSQKYFLMSISDFKDKAMKYYPSNILNPTITAGTVLIPIKMRVKPFDFSKDFTLGPTFGLKWRASHYYDRYFNLMAGFGVTSVSLDSATTNGKVLTNITDRPALTYSLGAIMEFGAVQVGVFAGKDYISQKDKISWIYQGKTWFSIGLGYTMFNRQDKPAQAGSGFQPLK